MAVSRNVSKHPAHRSVGPADPRGDDGLAPDEAPQAVESVTEVTVLAPYQVNHLGVVYGTGERVQVPQSLAERWARDGWVTSAST